MMRSIVLLSGGIDSAVNLAFAVLNTEVVLCLTADYGQQPVKQEIAAARSLAEFYNCPHEVVQLPFLAELQVWRHNLQEETKHKSPRCLDGDPEGSASERKKAAVAWVPNRNALLVNVAACYAEVIKSNYIITGFNREEALIFPDNTSQFVEAINGSLAYSTTIGVKALSYTQRLNKAEILALGQRLGLPFHLTWSCYYADKHPCGVCLSCLHWKRAKMEIGEEE